MMILSWIDNLSSSGAEFWSSVFTAVAIIAGLVLAIGLIGEFSESKRWKESNWYALAKVAVILGVSVELIGDAGIFKTSARLQKLTDDSILSNIKVEKATLDQLKARGFTKDQFDNLVRSLKGKWGEVAVYTLTDTEASFFGNAIMEAFQKAGAKVDWMRPQVPTDVFTVEGVPTTGVYLYVSQETPGFKDVVQNFFDSFNRAGVTGLSGGTPVKSIAGIPSPSIFVCKHEVPFMQFPEYELPAGIKLPKPAWEP